MHHKDMLFELLWVLKDESAAAVVSFEGLVCERLVCLLSNHVEQGKTDHFRLFIYIENEAIILN